MHCFLRSPRVSFNPNVTNLASASSQNFSKPHITMNLNPFFEEEELFPDEEEELYPPDVEPSHTVVSILYRDLLGMFICDTRNSPVNVQRMDWVEHRDRQIRRGAFNRMYRMSVDAFNELVELLREALSVNVHMADVRSRAGVIIPEIRVHCLIRYLSGGSYLDIAAVVNIHHSTFYAIIWSTCKAINACSDLGFSFPETLPELQEASDGFESISTHGVMRGCIGAIDGWLCPMIVPPRALVGNVRSYFSGHYQRCGVNVQAVVDHHCRFIYMAVAAPGSQPDINALNMINLPRVLAAPPLGFFIIGDNAYPASKHLVPIFGGGDRSNQDNDNFNYYLSQCCIRVEMAFGLMTQRWGVLARPLCINPRGCIGIFMITITRLHNYTINHNQDLVNEAYASNRNDGPGMVQAAEPPAAPIHGESVICKHLVARVREMGLRRPD
jgi:hypothetical protein